MKGFAAKQVSDQAGRCFVVTGANTGLGFEISRVLVRRGAKVIMACRNEDKAREAIARLLAEAPGADLGFAALDQADLASVRACAQRLGQEPRVDVLINNAGVMMPPLSRTAQGHEMQFGVNHLAPFVLTGLLLPKLAEFTGARVVVTASLAHRSARIDWDDLDAHQRYSRRGRYCDSKLMNLLFAAELDRRLRAAGSGVSAMCCHPGIASTELSRNLPAVGRALWPILCSVLNTAEMGAWPALQAACDPEGQSGAYFGPQQMFEARGSSGVARRSKAARDPDAARRLWAVSEEMTGLRYPQ